MYPKTKLSLIKKVSGRDLTLDRDKNSIFGALSPKETNLRELKDSGLKMQKNLTLAVTSQGPALVLKDSAILRQSIETLESEKRETTYSPTVFEN